VVRLPDLRLEIVEDISPPGQTGFLQLVRRRYRVHYPDGTVSEPFLYDMVDRRAIDAVVIVAHFRSEDGVRHVYLRSAFRPPVVLREMARSPDPNETVLSSTWELPAGLIDVEEQKPGGAARAAQRELHEELGFDVALEQLKQLGEGVFVAPGFIAEKQFFFEVDVTGQTRMPPLLDGSALEHFGEIVSLPLSEALRMCARAEINDSKSELVLRRLAERLS
jgi:ADP-ribose pyrophosphatase